MRRSAHRTSEKNSRQTDFFYLRSWLSAPAKVHVFDLLDFIVRKALTVSYYSKIEIMVQSVFAVSSVFMTSHCAGAQRLKIAALLLPVSFLRTFPQIRSLGRGLPIFESADSELKFEVR